MYSGYGGLGLVVDLTCARATAKKAGYTLGTVAAHLSGPHAIAR